jgi:hypothetical protein
LVKPRNLMKHSFMSWLWSWKVVLFQEIIHLLRVHASILFLVTVVLYFICSNIQSYHANPTFCKCFYNQRSHILFHFVITPFKVFLNLRRCVTLTTHPHLVLRLRMSRSYTSSHPICLHGM